MEKFKFKKKFGQNFLKDKTTIYKIVESIKPNKDDLIMEIGPGAGAITKELLKYNCQYIGFEIDEETKKYLCPLENEKTHFIYNDILNVELKNVIKNYKYKNLYIVGNLPYYITTPIIDMITKSGISFDSLTIMVQKEVANRIMSLPHNKEYGFLTVWLSNYYNIVKICDVSKNCFIPTPKVDSTVIKLLPKQPLIVNDRYENFLHECFQFKRKTIKNNLKKYNQEKLKEVLLKHGLDVQTRPEDIDLNTYNDLFDTL